MQLLHRPLSRVFVAVAHEGLLERPALIVCFDVADFDVAVFHEQVLGFKTTDGKVR